MAQGTTQTSSTAAFGAAGLSHGKGLVPDPGTAASVGNVRRLGEDGLWHFDECLDLQATYGPFALGADITTELQAAINLLAAANIPIKRILLPCGYYLISSTVTFPNPCEGLQLTGYGGINDDYRLSPVNGAGTVLRWNGASGGTMFSGPLTDSYFSDFVIEGNVLPNNEGAAGRSRAAFGILLTQSAQIGAGVSMFERMTFRDFTTAFQCGQALSDTNCADLRFEKIVSDQNTTFFRVVNSQGLNYNFTALDANYTRTIFDIQSGGNIRLDGTSNWAVCGFQLGQQTQSTQPSWNSGTLQMTFTTPADHRYHVGDSITQAGFTPSGYNGNFAIVSTTHNTYTVAMASNPGAVTVFGTSARTYIAAALSAASWATNVTTYTTAAAHNLVAGNRVMIRGASGATDTGYNGIYTVVSVPSTTTFTVSQTTSPGTYSASGAGYPATPTVYRVDDYMIKVDGDLSNGFPICFHNLRLEQASQCLLTGISRSRVDFNYLIEASGGNNTNVIMVNNMGTEVNFLYCRLLTNSAAFPFLLTDSWSSNGARGVNCWEHTIFDVNPFTFGNWYQVGPSGALSNWWAIRYCSSQQGAAPGQPIPNLEHWGAIPLTQFITGANNAITPSDTYVVINAGGGTTTYALPSATGQEGRRLSVTRADAGTGTVQVTGGVGQAALLRAQGQSVTYHCDGANWYPEAQFLGDVTAVTGQASPANPTGTTSTTGVMMGLASGLSTLTPVATGKILVHVCGDITNSTSGDGANVQIRWGTGTGPANAAALSGTTAGGLVKFVAASATNKSPFALCAVVSGLALGTAVWVDVGLAAVTGGTATIADVSVSAVEV